MKAVVKIPLVVCAILLFLYGLLVLSKLQGEHPEVAHNIVVATLLLTMSYCVASGLNLLYPEYDMRANQDQ